ncbi:MAG: RdgB/HAM1 family non-canonical purine NTP pyrophosphatase [Bryobacteraceae bacterium]
MKLFCATKNPGKVREFQMAARHFGRETDLEIEMLPGLDAIDPPEETGSTFAENAALKAIYYSQFCDGTVFADDSGLAVDALNGAPGIYSARFAGEGAGDAENNALLMDRMRGQAVRSARFLCAIAVAREGKLLGTFEGAVEGEMLDAPRGRGGFGYDPLFFYPPFACTLAEVDEARKMNVSHRGKALAAMLAGMPEPY